MSESHPFTCPECHKECDYLHAYPFRKAVNFDGFDEREACQACARKGSHEWRWKGLCPPLYQETDPSHPNFDQAKLAKVNAWTAKTGGLVLYGPSGRGKTRAAYLALRRHYDSGVDCFAINHVQFARASSDQFHERREREARELLEKCDKVDLLLFDDLGKAKMTERAELDLYSMLETRAAYNRPLIITTNADQDRLGESMSEDRAEPILRRIREFVSEEIEW